MNFSVEQNNGVAVLKIEGEVDMHSSPRLRAGIQELLQKKAKKICCDLSAVKYMDSSGIATLIEAQQKLAKEKGELRLAGPSQSIRSVLEIARLDKFFKVFPSLADAVKGF